LVVDCLEGDAAGECLPRHRHEEFLKFVADQRPRDPQTSTDPPDSSITTAPTSTPTSTHGSPNTHGSARPSRQPQAPGWTSSSVRRQPATDCATARPRCSPRWTSWPTAWRDLRGGAC